MNISEVNEGDIFSIPLFLNRESNIKNFSRYKFGKPGQEFCFCRLISKEGGSGLIIEVFNYVGEFNSNVEHILNSPRLIDPVSVSGLGITKGRWRKIAESENYDKEVDSKYSDIKLLIGPKENQRVWQGGKEYPLSSFSDVHSIEPFDIWPEVQLENRILAMLKA